MSASFDQNPGLYLAEIFVGLMVLTFTIYSLFGRPRLDYVPLPSHKPRLADAGVPWYLKFLYARGKFSPRLLAAWLTAGYTARVIEHYMGAKAYAVGQTIIQPTDMVPLIIALLGMVTTLFGFGTLQTTVLGDLAPAPGAGNTSTSPAAPDAQA